MEKRNVVRKKERERERDASQQHTHTHTAGISLIFRADGRREEGKLLWCFFDDDAKFSFLCPCLLQSLSLSTQRQYDPFMPVCMHFAIDGSI